MYGDLKERFEDEVINNDWNEDERAELMTSMNIMCGNVEIDCAYSLYHGIVSHQWCHDSMVCDGQVWNNGFDDWMGPCDLIEDEDHSYDLWEIIMRDNRVCFVFESCYNPKFQILVPRSQMDSLQL